jgi:hypothetical protein
LIPIEKKLSSQPKKLTGAPLTVHHRIGQGLGLLHIAEERTSSPSLCRKNAERR